MSTNPFDDGEAIYLVLINDEGQYSLWPAFAAVPTGWRVAHEQDNRDACLKCIADRWVDMRPNPVNATP